MYNTRYTYYDMRRVVSFTYVTHHTLYMHIHIETYEVQSSNTQRNTENTCTRYGI